MKIKNRASLIAACCLILFGSIAVFADDPPPPWMKQAASGSVPAYDKDVSAVVLHTEKQVTLNSDGKLITVENHAVKILNNEGRGHAVARSFYYVSSGKIRELNA